MRVKLEDVNKAKTSQKSGRSGSNAAEIMTIQGLHHITLICSDAQRTIDFYTRVLGLRFVKKTVNFDDPGSYHLYFGDDLGRPGSAITFFEWPGTPRGHPGIGGTHHFALTAPHYSALLKWKRRLTDLDISVNDPRDEYNFASISFNDPDGTILEITSQDNTPSQAGTWDEAVPEITPDMALRRGMHHITAISSNLAHTQKFFGDLLGLPRVDDPQTDRAYWRVGHALITYSERDARKEPRARFGAGQTHHFALAVPDERTQLEWRAKLVQAGLRVTPVMDRVYFKSIYTNDPDGHIVELATAGPGFAVDEAAANLGTSLKLPPWLEEYRAEIEAHLHPVTAPPWGAMERV